MKDQTGVHKISKKSIAEINKAFTKEKQKDEKWCTHCQSSPCDSNTPMCIKAQIAKDAEGIDRDKTTI